MTESSVRPVTVLLVEDSDLDAAAFETMLRTAAPGAFDLDRATSLAEATAYLKIRTPDCTVLDLKLTDAEGVEMIESLAVLSSAVALIVLIGHPDDHLDVSDIVAGAIDYLPKSGLDGPIFANCIRHAIVRTRFESSLAEAQSIAKLGSWDLDLVTGTMRCSRELYKLFGFRLDEKPAYDSLIDRTHPDDREATLQAHRATMEGFMSFKVEHRIVLRRGLVRWVRARGRVELDTAGQPKRLLGTAQDITEQKAAETALLTRRSTIRSAGCRTASCSWTGWARR